MTLHWCESLGYVNAFNILVQWKQNIDNHVTHVMIVVRSLIWPRYSIAESALPMSNFWQTESTNVLKLLTIHVNDIQRSCWQPVELTFWSSSCVADSLRCPAPGKGKKMKEWDFSRIQRFRTTGIRDETLRARRPMCQDDFLEYFTQKCPRFQRCWDWIADSTPLSWTLNIMISG